MHDTYCYICNKYGCDGGGLLYGKPLCESCFDEIQVEKEIERKMIINIYSKTDKNLSKQTAAYIDKIRDRD